MAQIQTLALPPASSQQKKNWTAYRARFVEPQRIRAGLQFWSDNADALQRAETQYGVPASIIVGVICLLGAVLRLGRIAQLVSRPVFAGYLSGVAVAETAATCQLELAFAAGPGARSRAAEKDRGQSETESGLEQQWVPDLPALWIADHYLSPPKAEPKAPRTVANR